jgi:hypothetical protein
MPSVGEQIVNAIIAGQLVRAECARHPDCSCVLIWSANVYEQLDQIVNEYHAVAHKLKGSDESCDGSV